MSHRGRTADIYSRIGPHVLRLPPMETSLHRELKWLYAGRAARLTVAVGGRYRGDTIQAVALRRRRRRASRARAAGPSKTRLAGSGTTWTTTSSR